VSDFEEEPRGQVLPFPRDEAFRLRLDGYEGPIDALLDLARHQKVDLTQISILDLAEQYLAFIECARNLRLELAADYLVMAAWLAYLKSRLLLPEPEESDGEEPSGAEMAAALAFQLQRLQALRESGEALMKRPQLDIDVFRRGAPEPVAVAREIAWQVSLYDLLKCYGNLRQTTELSRLDIPATQLFSVEEAIGRLTRMLGEMPGWRPLMTYLPERLGSDLKRRSAVAATFTASLELVRQGRAELRQDGSFGPIYLRPAGERPGGRGGEPE